MDKENGNSQQTLKIKELISYIPLATSVLVFFGFLNYDLYYRKLEIEIFSFLETSELIFSFVNLIYPIILTAILMNLFPYLMVNTEKRREKSKEETEEEILQNEEKSKKLDFDYSFKGIYANIKSMFAELMRKNFRKAFSFFKTVFAGSSFRLVVFAVWVYEIVVGIILMFGIMGLDARVDSTSTEYEINSTVFLAMSFLWALFLFIYLYQKFAANNEKLKMEVSAGIILLILIANLNIHQFYLASDTVNDRNVKNVRFEYKGNDYTTNGSKSLIGVTKNYIFLRETLTGENLIFKLSEVSNMVFFYDESLREKVHNDE